MNVRVLRNYIIIGTELQTNNKISYKISNPFYYQLKRDYSQHFLALELIAFGVG